MLIFESKIATGTFRWILLCLMVGMLILVRGIEEVWFKDAFMLLLEGAEKSEYLLWSYHLKLPLRYVVNSALSLVILYLIFLDRGVVKVSAILLGIGLLLLFPIYLWLIAKATINDYMPVFYVRRFLAHPILLLVLLMGFSHEHLNRQTTHKA